MQIHPRLGGGKLGDPSLYIDIVDRKRGILFDCGLNNFGHASLHKLSDLFISHTHIDHFIGFDTLLRLNLAENKTLHVYGPPGIYQNVSGKLQAYTWNICQTLQLTIVVHEILPEHILLTEMKSHLGFQVTRTERQSCMTTLLTTDEFSYKRRSYRPSVWNRVPGSQP
jgi:ribonuclease Z